MMRCTDHKSDRVLTICAWFSEYPNIPVEYDVLEEYVIGVDKPEQVFVVRDLDEIVRALSRTENLEFISKTEKECVYYD